MSTDGGAVKPALRGQRIETPSWAYGNSGTRFKVFAQPGVPRSAYEKVDDAAAVHRVTGLEPAFYTTDVPDWGTAFAHCLQLGPKAQVVIDTGHHAPGTNIEFIVAVLLRAGKLGGFDFNSRFYADDDLMVGSADPFQLFRIMHEIVKADALGPEAGIAFMLDQSHNVG